MGSFCVRNAEGDMIRSYGKPYGFAGGAAGVFCEHPELVDEYQIQTPKSFVKLLPIIFDGKERLLNKKGELESDSELANRLAKEIAIENRIMAGKPKLINGEWFAAYSPVGELMVKCVEKAAQIMGFPVHITGEYLVGLPSEGWAGTH